MKFLVVFTAFWYVIDATRSVTSYPADQSSRVSAFSATCVSYIDSCPLTQSKCASQICGICTNLGITPPIEQCCRAADPTICFQNNYVHGVTSTAVSTPPLSLTSALAGCKSFYSIVYSCAAATPGFQNLYFSDMQSCICTTSGTFAPNYYDRAYSSCLSFASKYDPAEYSQLGPVGGGSFSGTFTGIAISHGLGSRPCHAFYEYTQTTTPGPVSSQPSVPPPQTSTSAQGGQAINLGGGMKVQKVIVVVITNLYIVLRL